MWKLYVSLLLYLAYETRSDIRSREISVKAGLLSSMAAVILRIVMGELRWNTDGAVFLFQAVIPGVLLLLAGKITRQAIGYGDGILMVVCGFYLGGRMAGLLFLTGLFCLFPVSLLLLLSGKVKREQELPFAPFLLMAYMIWILQLV